MRRLTGGDGERGFERFGDGGGANSGDEDGSDGFGGAAARKAASHRRSAGAGTPPWQLLVTALVSAAITAAGMMVWGGGTAPPAPLRPPAHDPAGIGRDGRLAPCEQPQIVVDSVAAAIALAVGKPLPSPPCPLPTDVRTAAANRHVAIPLRPAAVSSVPGGPGVGSPGVVTQTRAIVVSYHKEDIAWLPVYFPHLTHFVYVANDTLAPHHQLHLSGREAGAFLTFIVDYYDTLPDVMAFVHAHRYAYHTWSNDIVNALSRLRWDRVTGYVSLNLAEFQTLAPGYHNWDYIREKWADLFAADIAPTVPESVDAYCCAQFVVRREDVRRRPKRFYQRLLEFVFDPTINIDSPRVLEHAWHFIMGQSLSMQRQPICEVMVCDEGDATGMGSSLRVENYFARLDARAAISAALGGDGASTGTALADREARLRGGT